MPISRRYCFSSSVIAPFHYQTPSTFFFLFLFLNSTITFPAPSHFPLFINFFFFNVSTSDSAYQEEEAHIYRTRKGEKWKEEGRNGRWTPVWSIYYIFCVYSVKKEKIGHAHNRLKTGGWKLPSLKGLFFSFTHLLIYFVWFCFFIFFNIKKHFYFILF